MREPADDRDTDERHRRCRTAREAWREGRGRDACRPQPRPRPRRASADPCSVFGQVGPCDIGDAAGGERDRHRGDHGKHVGRIEASHVAREPRTNRRDGKGQASREAARARTGVGRSS